MSDETIRAEAKKALRDRGLKCVIGWSADGTPLFAETEEDVEKLSFNEFCANNLVPYLTQEIRSQRGKTRDGKEKIVKPVGIVVKGCDSKALLLLLNENILSRKEVFIIGIPCTGVADKHAGGALYKKCIKCAMRNPAVYDVLASEKVQEDTKDYSENEGMLDALVAAKLRARGCSVLVIYADSLELERQAQPPDDALEMATRARRLEMAIDFRIMESLGVHVVPWSVRQPLAAAIRAARLDRAERRVH